MEKEEAKEEAKENIGMSFVQYSSYSYLFTGEHPNMKIKAICNTETIPVKIYTKKEDKEING